MLLDDDDFSLWWSRKHFGKRKKCWLTAFSSFPTVFSKAFFVGVVKSRDCVVESFNPCQFPGWSESILFADALYPLFTWHGSCTFQVWLNSVPNAKLLCQSKLKALKTFCNMLLKTLWEKNKMLITSISSFFPCFLPEDRGLLITGNQHFLLFPHCFLIN